MVDFVLKAGCMPTKTAAKAFAANLAVSLLAFVDPLSMYGGKYEAPPPRDDDGDDAEIDPSGLDDDRRERSPSSSSELKRQMSKLPLSQEARIITLLQTAAFRSSIVWSLLLCGSVANILYAIVQQDMELPGEDVLWATLFAYAAAVVVAALFCKCLFGKLEAAEKKPKDMGEGLVSDSPP